MLKNIESLEESVSALEKENSYLKEQNIKLSGIIHRDNKVLPALKEAVATLVDGSDNTHILELKSHLQEITNQRQELIADYKENFTSLPCTGIITLDAAIKFLHIRALKEKCAFLFYYEGNANLFCSKLTITDLVGLICDIGENAIIATRDVLRKNIYIHICATDENLFIEFFDSGTNFNAEALRSLGKRQYTSHKKDGGSGIGLMSIYSLIEKYKFSFELNECVVSPYSKSIKIIFDDNSNINILTQRQEILRLEKERGDFNISEIK